MRHSCLIPAFLFYIAYTVLVRRDTERFRLTAVAKLSLNKQMNYLPHMLYSKHVVINIPEFVSYQIVNYQIQVLF